MAVAKSLKGPARPITPDPDKYLIREGSTGIVGETVGISEGAIV